jgi:hypothetical protein
VLITLPVEASVILDPNDLTVPGFEFLEAGFRIC